MSTFSSLLPIALAFGTRYGLTKISFQAKGAFKETFQAYSATRGSMVALKLLEPSKCNLARSEREISALIKCDSPYIARLYEYGDFVTGKNEKYYFTIEQFFHGGTLASLVATASIEPATLRAYAVDLVQALDHLRSAGLVHRDIKPDNIMFEAGHAVLVDFGLVRDLAQSSLTHTWLPHGPGTPLYSSPEQLNNEKTLIGWRSDQFSLGVVLSMCLTAKHPFQFSGATIPEAVDAVSRRLPLLDDFKQTMSALRFPWVPKMVELWPIRRYLTPKLLLEAMEESRL